MYCSKCGRKNHDTAAFCGKCGHPLTGRSVSSSAGPVGSNSASPAPTPGPATTPGPFSRTIPSAPPVQPQTKTPSKNKKIIGIGVAVAAVVAIAVIAFLVVGGSGFGGGRSTSDQVAQDLSKSYGRLLSSGLTPDGITDFCNDVLNMMPKEAADAMLREAGVTDRADLQKLLSSRMGMSTPSSYAGYLEKLDIDVSFFVGEEMSPAKLDSINAKLQQIGVEYRAASGKVLGANVSYTALENVMGMSKGETKTQTQQNAGLYAVNIDGKWYAWLG